MKIALSNYEKNFNKNMKFIGALIFSSILAIGYSEELVCNGENEQLSLVTPMCPLNCETLGKVRCLGLVNKPSCQCITGTVREAANGKCIKQEACPKPAFFEELLCNGVDEHKSLSTPVCPLTCATLGKAHCLSLTNKPSCQCNTGTVRDLGTGQCVKQENCPKPNTQTFFEELLCNGENEHYSPTTPGCAIPHCQNRTEFFNCLVILMKPSCQCNTGTIRDNTTNKCVKPEECPK